MIHSVKAVLDIWWPGGQVERESVAAALRREPDDSWTQGERFGRAMQTRDSSGISIRRDVLDGGGPVAEMELYTLLEQVMEDCKLDRLLQLIDSGRVQAQLTVFASVSGSCSFLIPGDRVGVVADGTLPVVLQVDVRSSRVVRAESPG